ncbi:TetR/AcrR family transcriptional regulator [Nocardia jiangsuensis]|uniref:TetR/AcrR family transcriptional regulator n=1 Tax=Nocardia jiangsuensis TaxID=1691563 RepID=A0ABV8DSN5_9NOCA
MSQWMDTRELILEAVVRIIGTHGAAAVTNRRIAAEADVSPGTLTYHFATQRDLVRSALASFVADEALRFQEVTCQLAARNPDLAAEQTTLDDIVSSTGDSAAWFEFIIQVAHHPELHEATAGFFDTYDELAEQVLRAEGVADVENVAPIAVGLLIGSQLRRLATGGSVDDVSAVMSRLTQLLHGTAGI